MTARGAASIRGCAVTLRSEGYFGDDVENGASQRNHGHLLPDWPFAWERALDDCPQRDPTYKYYFLASYHGSSSFCGVAEIQRKAVFASGQRRKGNRGPLRYAASSGKKPRIQLFGSILLQKYEDSRP